MFPRFLSRHAAAVLTACVVLLGAPQLSRADDIADGRKLVQSVVKEAVDSFAGKQTTPAERSTLLHGFIDRYGDVNLSSKDILGHYWTKMTPEQQAEFQVVVVDYAIGSWSKQLADFPADQRVDFTESETLSNGRTLLHSLASHTGDIAPVDWTIAKSADGRLVIADVSLEGVSMIQTMRGDFLGILRANGGDPAVLIAALKQKIASYQQ